MSAAETTTTNPTDQKLLAMLQEGRITPAYALDEIDVTAKYINDRLDALCEAGEVRRLRRGLYELPE